MKVTQDCLLSCLKKDFNAKPLQKQYDDPDLCLQKLLKAFEEQDLENIDILLPQAEFVAKKVVSKLSLRQATTLVNAIEIKIMESSYKGNHLFHWLRTILSYHSTLLEGIPNVNTMFQNLHKIISTRRRVYVKMQRLSGRIDLIFDMSSSAEISDNQKAVQEDKAKLEIDVPMTLSSDSA